MKLIKVRSHKRRLGKYRYINIKRHYRKKSKHHSPSSFLLQMRKKNIELRPDQKMDTILMFDKKISKMEREELEGKRFNEQAKKALKRFGYNDEDIVGYLSNINKPKEEEYLRRGEEYKLKKELMGISDL